MHGGRKASAWRKGRECIEGGKRVHGGRKASAWREGGERVQTVMQCERPSES